MYTLNTHISYRVFHPLGPKKCIIRTGTLQHQYEGYNDFLFMLMYFMFAPKIFTIAKCIIRCICQFVIMCLRAMYACFSCGFTLKVALIHLGIL